MIIYKITNKINNKVYIGQTITTLHRRWRNHVGKGNALHNAIKKYGEENFIVETIDTAVTQEELNDKEKVWIKHYNSIAPNGYNLSSGGSGCGSPCEETKRKISIACRRLKLTEETKLRIGRASKRRGMPEEAKRKALEYVENKKRPVICIETDEMFNSISAAAKHFNISDGAVRSAIKENRSVFNNFSFKYAEKPDRTPTSQSTIDKIKAASKNKSKPVLCIETNTIFKSVKEAAIWSNTAESNIISVLKGHTRKAKGYSFKYI